MILLIDNYDSFTYNIYQYLCELGADVRVVRNDEATVDEIADMAPREDRRVPGPEHAGEGGRLQRGRPAARQPRAHAGVCLGHQCVGYSYGGTVGPAGEIMHGKMSLIHHNGKGVLKGIPSPFEAIRYHSLAISPDDLPEELEVTAWTTTASSWASSTRPTRSRGSSSTRNRS